MTTQQPYALQCAADLEYSIARHGMQDAFTLNAYRAMKMVRTQHARITELESQLAQRFDVADMATAAAQGFRDGGASVAHQPITDTNTASGAADKVLAYLDDLSDDAAAHIFPSDLAKCMTSECVVEVVSVRAGNPNERTVPLFSREQVVAALASTPAQAGVPAKSAAYAALPEPLEIDWPELHSQALGCGVEDRGLHNRYECAEYGWQDGVDKCAERVPEQIFDADQMLAFADATHMLRASHGQAPAGANENAELVTLIAECRDAFPIPAHGDPIENYWIAAIADPSNVPAYLQEIAKRKQAASVLYDPKAVLDVFNSARAGSDKSSGYLRGILAVIAHWESRPEPHRWMVPVQAQAAESVPAGDERATFEANWRVRNPHMPLNSRLRDDGRYGDHLIQKEWEAWQARAARASADSVQEDAARYRWLREQSSTLFVNISINGEGAEIAETLDSAVDAARKQGGA